MPGFGLSITGQAMRLRRAAATPLSARADIYVDADTAITGTDSDVAGIVTGGRMAVPLNMVRTGSGANIERTTDGFRFGAGRYLRWTGTGDIWRGAMVVADVTIHGNPTGTGMILLLENDLNSRLFLRYIPNGLLSGLGPNQNVSVHANIHGFGSRQTVAFLVDRDQQHLEGSDQQAVMSADGFLEAEPGTAPMADIALNDVRIGSGCDMTLHRLAVFGMRPGEALADTPRALWHGIDGVPERVFSTSQVEVLPFGGQSEALGPITTASERVAFNHADRHGVKILSGLDRSDGANITIIGPSTLGYNAAVNADGIVPAKIANNLMVGHPAAVALNQFRLPGSPPILTGFNGYAGERIEDFDSDPLTGSGQVIIYNNEDFWLSQAAQTIAAEGKTPVCNYTCFIQGQANKTNAPGVWRAGFDAFWADHLATVQNHIPGANPKLVIAQTSGDGDTTNDTWNLKGEQLDLAAQTGALLVPMYACETQVDLLHPDVNGTLILGETFGWAIAEDEAGRAWNIARPAVSLAGNDLTLTFALRPGESLVAHSAARYGGEGISDLGFEVEGATITGVSLSGASVTLSCDAPPTAWRYAMQSQDLTGATALFPAHRGLLRTDTTLVGPQSGATLYRWVPSLPTTSV